MTEKLLTLFSIILGTLGVFIGGDTLVECSGILPTLLFGISILVLGAGVRSIVKKK